jgi:hypothetical protein
VTALWCAPDRFALEAGSETQRVAWARFLAIGVRRRRGGGRWMPGGPARVR